MTTETLVSDVDEDRKAMGERLREAREYLGFSQSQVATFLGVPRSALLLIETGQREVDALELKKLASLYRQPVGRLAGEKNEAPLFDGDAELADKLSKLSPKDREEIERFMDFLRFEKMGE